MKKELKAIFLLAKPRVLRAIVSFYFSGYLKEVGWFKSFEEKQPVDADLKPVAWVTYPFLHFIEERLGRVRNIFEYGSGSSTLYYSKFVGDIVSVEHDEGWFRKVKGEMPVGVDLYYCELVEDGRYSRFCAEIERVFDVIIVDGRDRVNCIKNSLDSLSREGVIVLDDSERERYSPGVEFLMGRGFKRIDFWGVSPGLFYKKCTTIFYKDNNVLGI